MNLWQGVPMRSHFELSSRAALCRQLAKREPNNRALWMAEAESWSRLSQEPSHILVPRRGESTRSYHWRVLPNRNWLCLRGKGGHSQSLKADRTVGKDPLEDFLDRMAIENGE
jgi:hypothetical protein